MDMKCKLTISVLASNRKDTIPKCLESLKALLDAVDSELIVTDTGCDEELLDVIRKYTDKIVKFTWCNDFAAARNVGLNMASGQWFMFIDDDEWFENVNELIEFFNGEEEKEYESANYVVRNYYTKSGGEYSEWVVRRVFRIHKDTRFVGKVHEYATIKEGKIKQFLSYVHHYGYAFETVEQRKVHSNRNISLLEKEIESNPRDGRNYAHIYQEYRANDEPDIILKYAKMAMKNVDLNYEINKFYMYSTYVAILWAYMRLERYEEVIKEGERFLSNVPGGGMACASIYFYLVDGYLLCENYNKCIEYAKEYIKIYKTFSKNKERYYMEIAPMLNETLKTHVMYGVYIAGIESAIKKNSMEDICYFLKMYDWTKGWDDNKLDYFKEFVDMTISNEENEDVIYIYGMIFTDVQCSKVVMNRLQEIKETDIEGYAKVCNILAKIAGQPGYRSLTKVITSCKNGNEKILKNLYETIYIEDDKILLIDNEFYEIALVYGIDLGSVIEGISLKRWEELLNLWLMNARNKDILRTKKYMDIFLKRDSKKMELIEQMLIEELKRRKK